MDNPIYIVDVFAERLYSGNQLAVVVVHEKLSTEVMQRIAAEMNFSETTFVDPVPAENEGYPVRMFTPSKELEFAGHPILGTAYVIKEYIQKSVVHNIQLNLAQNTVSVEFEAADEGGSNEICWFTAPPISLGETLPLDNIADVLGILPTQINSDIPIQMASSGTSAIIVPLKSLAALKKCKFDREKYTSLMEKGFPPLCYLFTEETREKNSDLSARFFFDANGMREDPATGNGAAFLGKYLFEHNYFKVQQFKLKIDQGHEVGRPSLVMLQVEGKQSECEIKVGGQVLPVSIGNLI